MSYRPDDWDEQKRKTLQKLFSDIKPFHPVDMQLVEAGADAMLEVLKGIGEQKKEDDWEDYGFTGKGWVVFIPEDM